MESLDHHYSVLGLKPHSTLEEIEKAYRDLLTRWLEECANEPHMVEKAYGKMNEIKNSYKVLRSFHEEKLVYLKSSSHIQQIETSTYREIESNSDYKDHHLHNRKRSGRVYLIATGIICIYIIFLLIFAYRKVLNNNEQLWNKPQDVHEKQTNLDRELAKTGKIRAQDLFREEFNREFRKKVVTDMLHSDDDMFPILNRNQSDLSSKMREQEDKMFIYERDMEAKQQQLEMDISDLRSKINR